MIVDQIILFKINNNNVLIVNKTKKIIIIYNYN